MTFSAPHYNILFKYWFIGGTFLEATEISLYEIDSNLSKSTLTTDFLLSFSRLSASKSSLTLYQRYFWLFQEKMTCK